MMKLVDLFLKSICLSDISLRNLGNVNSRICYSGVKLSIVLLTTLKVVQRNQEIIQECSIRLKAYNYTAMYKYMFLPIVSLLTQVEQTEQWP